MEDIRKIYELEAIVKQAEDLIYQLRGAVNALKPPPIQRKKMTKDDMKQSFRKACKDAERRKRIKGD